ncbi:MAG TPA: hypothetical protein VFH43_05765 [Candidatus Kapabacteria bacterium]|nr:hypothetical protein [Candidatus Kapabacteria bacterium]
MRHARALVVLVVLGFTVILSPTSSYAQLEHSVWYFGYGFGLDFRSDPPTLLREGGLEAFEGSASICDPETGAPLFYTDGVKVWNKDHQVMPNGNDLFSEQSSSQAAVIFPAPGDKNRYYIFTVDQSGYRGPSRGINYSIVDMTLDGGRGDVTTKNVNLLGPSSERITAVKVCGGSAYWVIGHELGSARHFAWYVDANGVDTQPVISNIGTIHGPGWEDGIGWMAASADGTKLASVFYMRPAALPHVELYRFDPTTGIISDPVNLYKSVQPYGVAFSPSGRYLYVTSVARLEQYDLSNWDYVSIENSQWYAPSGTNENGAIKAGPDGKLYVQHSAFLSLIEFPEQQGDNCNYRNAYTLGDFRQWGLSNNVDAHSQLKCGIPDALIKRFDTLICVGECVNFYDSSRRGAINWEWEFEGTTDQRYIGKDALNICYTEPGRYAIKLFASNETGVDTAFAWITVRECPVPSISLRDTTICKGKSIVFADTSLLETDRSWQFEGGEPATATGTVTPEIRYFTPGTHKVTFIASNEFGADTAIAFVTVEDCPDPVALAEFDTVICVGEMLSFVDRSLNSPTQWDWSFDGASPASSSEKDPQGISYAVAGYYSVRQIVHNSVGVDTAFHRIRVNECLPPEARLNDVTICQGDSIDLQDISLTAPTAWEWTLDGTEVKTFYVQHPGKIGYDTAGTFSLRLVVANEYGSDTATSTITVLSAEAWTEGEIEFLPAVDLCSFVDTFITVYAGCRAIAVNDIVSHDLVLQLNLTEGLIAPNDSLRIPFIIAPTAIGASMGTISFTANGKDYVIRVKYSGKADVEQFAFSEFDSLFNSFVCDTIARELTISNNACAEHAISIAYITPANVGFRLEDQTFPLRIASSGTSSLVIHYAASVTAASEAELVIVTASGNERRLRLSGTRMIPQAGSVTLVASGPQSLLPNEKTSARVTLVDPIAAELAPSEIEIVFRYNTDLLSASSINAQGGWQVASEHEQQGTLTLLLRRPQSAVLANTTLLDIEFGSFLTTESTTELTVESIRCDPQDPDFESCIYRLETTDTSRVALLQVCGDDQMQDAMGRSRALSLRVEPHPVKLTEGLRFSVDVGNSELIGQPMIVELIDLIGKRTRVLETIASAGTATYTSSLQVAQGVYVLRVYINGSEQHETVIIE